MSIFDIVGPVMVGPSSSHTAGAVRIGKVCRKLLGSSPSNAKIYLHGSFASTGIGHGTDKAIIAGILGYNTDSPEIAYSFNIADKEKLSFSFHNINLKDAHPNTAVIELTDDECNKLKVTASSIGGGRIRINKINDINTDLSGEYPTLIIYCIDKTGNTAKITDILYDNNINIAALKINREKRGGQAIMIVETDHSVSSNIINMIKNLDITTNVLYFNLNEQE
jgi:L-serine dehydratase, iron-sulfur-dependent, beta subunit